MSAPVPSAKTTGSTPVIVAIILVLGLAIMYLFTRVRKQDQAVERLRKENQQQLNDQDVMQLTKRYLQSQESYTYIRDTVAPLVDGLCLTYISREYPILLHLQSAAATSVDDYSQHHTYASPPQYESQHSLPLSASPSEHLVPLPVEVSGAAQPVFEIEAPPVTQSAQVVNLQLASAPLQVEHPPIEPASAPLQVEHPPIEPASDPLQVEQPPIEPASAPLHVEPSPASLEKGEPVEHVEQGDENDLSEPGSSPVSSESSSPSQIVSNNVSASSSAESTPRKKKVSAVKKPKKRPVAVKKKAGSRA
jgi:hypothetical protein